MGTGKPAPRVIAPWARDAPQWAIMKVKHLNDSIVQISKASKKQQEKLIQQAAGIAPEIVREFTDKLRKAEGDATWNGWYAVIFGILCFLHGLMRYRDWQEMQQLRKCITALSKPVVAQV